MQTIKLTASLVKYQCTGTYKVMQSPVLSVDLLGGIVDPVHVTVV